MNGFNLKPTESLTLDLLPVEHYKSDGTHEAGVSAECGACGNECKVSVGNGNFTFVPGRCHTPKAPQMIKNTLAIKKPTSAAATEFLSSLNLEGKVLIKGGERKIMQLDVAIEGGSLKALEERLRTTQRLLMEKHDLGAGGALSPVLVDNNM